MTTTLHPITGRPYGKPGASIRERIDRVPADALAHFSTPEMLSFYLAHMAETPACWPRVLEGTMSQERFQERTARMREAILRAGSPAA